MTNRPIPDNILNEFKDVVAAYRDVLRLQAELAATFAYVNAHTSYIGGLIKHAAGLPMSTTVQIDLLTGTYTPVDEEFETRTLM